MAKAFDDLKNGVVLAELGGHGDGPFCAEHGAGSALVIMGTYIVDAGDSVDYPGEFVFKPGAENFADYLRQHVRAAKQSGARVAVSVATTGLQDTISFLMAAQDAGADYASLCVYSTMEMFTSRKLGVELCRAENAGLLREWCGAIVRALAIPFIIKMGFEDDTQTMQAIEILKACGVPIFHVAVPAATTSSGLCTVRKLAEACPFLIVGGGIKDAAGAQSVCEAGADAVAIAGAAVHDAGICGAVQRQLQAKKSRG